MLGFCTACSEVLDKLSTEWQHDPDSPPSPSKPLSPSGSTSTSSSDVIGGLFRGRLVSQVTCKRCDSRSRTFEPFTDLSLEFPDRFHDQHDRSDDVRGGTKSRAPAGRDGDVSDCHVTEMLQKFTGEEKLDGHVYVCDKCNSKCI